MIPFSVFIANKSKTFEDFDTFAENYLDFFNLLLGNLKDRAAELEIPPIHLFNERKARRDFIDVMDKLIVEVQLRSLTYNECHEFILKEVMKNDDLCQTIGMFSMEDLKDTIIIATEKRLLTPKRSIRDFYSIRTPPESLARRPRASTVRSLMSELRKIAFDELEL